MRQGHTTSQEVNEHRQQGSADKDALPDSTDLTDRADSMSQQIDYACRHATMNQTKDGKQLTDTNVSHTQGPCLACVTACCCCCHLAATRTKNITTAALTAGGRTPLPPTPSTQTTQPSDVLRKLTAGTLLAPLAAHSTLQTAA
jgi:hypothetical protein